MSKLSRNLTLKDVFCFASGAMISSGLFILPGIAYKYAGGGIIFSYFFASILVLLGLLSQAELVSAMPKAGGEYFHISRSLGPYIGTIDGILNWFTLCLKSAFALLGMAAFISLILTVNPHIVATIVCLFFGILNFFGTKKSTFFQNSLIWFLIILLVLYILLGFQKINFHNFQHLIPVEGLKPIFYCSGLVFISYGGLLKSTSIAEEVKEPARIIPLGMLLSLLVVSILYILSIFVTVGLLGKELNGNLTPLGSGGEIIAGKPGLILMSFAAILAFTSTANAGIMSSARYLLALSRDGVLPSLFSKIHDKYKTPYIGIIFSCLVMILVLFFNLKILAEAGSTVLILNFALSSFSVIIMRESKIKNYRPKFKTPLYPFPQIISIIGSLFLIIEIGKDSFFITLTLLGISTIFYVLYGKMKKKKEYGLLYLIEKITNKRIITNHSLEQELKEIIKDRDNIAEDRFDELIKNSLFYDFPEKIGYEELFKKVSEEISKYTNIKMEVICNLLLEREKESSTVINTFVAIPHIIINLPRVFHITLVRAKKGIHFSEKYNNVKALFIIIGPKEQRNLHLKVISALAYIIQQENFEKEWIKAKNEEQIKDIFLLSERKRYIY